jgi:hypothetical protein
LINNNQINYSISDEVSGNNSQNLIQKKMNRIPIDNVNISIIDSGNKTIKLNKPVNSEIFANEPIKIHKGWNETLSDNDEYFLLILDIWRNVTDSMWNANIDSENSIKKITSTLNYVKIFDVDEDKRKLKLNKSIDIIVNVIPSGSWIFIENGLEKLFLDSKIISKNTLIKKLTLKIWQYEVNDSMWHAEIIDLEVQTSRLLDLENVKINSVEDKKISLNQDIPINETYTIPNNTLFEIYEGWNETISKDDEYAFLQLDIWKHENEYFTNIVMGHKKSEKKLENIKLNVVNPERKSIGLNKRIRNRLGFFFDISENEEIKIHKGWDKTFADNDEFALLNLKIWKIGSHFHADIESSSIKKEKVFIKDVEINYINLKDNINKFYPKITIKIKLSQSFIYNKNKIDSDTMISINKENWDKSIEVEDEFDPLVLNIWENNNNLYADYIKDKSINKRNISEPEEDLNGSNSKDNNEETKEPKNSSEDNNEKTESMNDLNNDKIKLKEINKTLSYITWKSAIITIFVSIIIIFLIIILFIYMLKIRKKRNI